MSSVLTASQCRPWKKQCNCGAYPVLVFSCHWMTLKVGVSPVLVSSEQPTSFTRNLMKSATICSSVPSLSECGIASQAAWLSSAVKCKKTGRFNLCYTPSKKQENKRKDVFKSSKSSLPLVDTFHVYGQTLPVPLLHSLHFNGLSSESTKSGTFTFTRFPLCYNSSCFGSLPDILVFIQEKTLHTLKLLIPETRLIWPGARDW